MAWALALVLLAVAVCMLVARALSLQAPLFQPHDRVLLVVAHPDDEAMFFSPTLLSLAMYGIPVFVLCLSNGGAYGIGKVREKELLASCAELKVPPSHVMVLDLPGLQDGASDWSAELVAQQLQVAMERYQPTQVVTFDAYGVSGHLNHRHTHRGVLHYKRRAQQQGCRTGTSGTPANTSDCTALRAGGTCTAAGGVSFSDNGTAADAAGSWKAGASGGRVKFYALESVNLMRKFSGLLDLPLSSLLLHTSRPHNGSHLVVSPSPGVGIRAMWRHRSQLAWYRIAFVLLSRFTMINTLREMEL